MSVERRLYGQEMTRVDTYYLRVNSGADDIKSTGTVTIRFEDGRFKKWDIRPELASFEREFLLIAEAVAQKVAAIEASYRSGDVKAD